MVYFYIADNYIRDKMLQNFWCVFHFYETLSYGLIAQTSVSISSQGLNVYINTKFTILKEKLCYFDWIYLVNIL